MIVILIVLAVLAVYATVNALLLRRLRNFSRSVLPERLPRVSLLIPVHNQGENLSRLLPSLMAQDYPHVEILVLNDSSTDQTQNVIEQFMGGDRRVWGINGKPLPSGWLSKNWACQQLADNASGDLFVFLEPDTIWSTRAVGELVSAMHNLKAQAISVWPQQLPNPFLAKLVQPVQQWMLVNFLPFALVSNQNYPMAVAANGQMIAFRRKCYEAIGGHEAVRANVLEALALARRVKGVGARFEFLSGLGSLAAETYKDNLEVSDGFARKTFPMLGFSVLNIFLMIAAFAMLYVVPWAWLLRDFVDGQNVRLPLLAVALGLYPRVLSDWLFGYPAWFVLSHPLSLFAWSSIALESWQRQKANLPARSKSIEPASNTVVLVEVADKPLVIAETQQAQLNDSEIPVPGSSEALDARLEREAKTLSKLDWDADDAFATQILPPQKPKQQPEADIAEA